MNLMDVESRRWDEYLLRACGGPELREKIGPEPVLGATALGKVTSWWVDRWGFDQGRSSKLIAWNVLSQNKPRLPGNLFHWRQPIDDGGTVDAW